MSARAARAPGPPGRRTGPRRPSIASWGLLEGSAYATPRESGMNCPACGAANEENAVVCFTCKAPLLALGRGDVLAGRWEIREFLGRGGMGAVYRVHDRTLNE